MAAGAVDREFLNIFWAQVGTLSLFDAFWGAVGLLWAPAEAPLGILWVSFWVVLALFGRLWALCGLCWALQFGVPFSSQMCLKCYSVVQKQASRNSAPVLPALFAGFSGSARNGTSTALSALGSTRRGPG